MRRILFANSCGNSCALAALSGHGPQPAAAPFVTHQISSTVYSIEGGGGNVGVILGQKGVIIVDAKTTPAGGKQLLDAIAKITPKPVTTAILTHSDTDHIGGLPRVSPRADHHRAGNRQKRAGGGHRARRPGRSFAGLPTE